MLGHHFDRWPMASMWALAPITAASSPVMVLKKFARDEDSSDSCASSYANVACAAVDRSKITLGSGKKSVQSVYSPFINASQRSPILPCWERCLFWKGSHCDGRTIEIGSIWQDGAGV
jgi:hypothetical protein